MKHRVRSTLVFLSTLALLAGCAAKQPATSFRPVDLTEKARAGGYSKNVDNFLIILDASGSMNETYKGKPKLEIGREIVERINRTIPDLGYVGGLRTFGNTISPFTRKTDRIYGMAVHNKEALSAALQDLGWAGGLSPMDHAGEAVAGDLKGVSGKTALIFISDAKEMDPQRPVDVARSVKEKMGDEICIYTILVGDDSAGRALMQRIAEAGGCGFAAEADDIESADAMGGYVEKVFLAKAAVPAGPADSDGDGVVDETDQCPGTPAGVVVTPNGCPVDTDGDSVADYQDRCPGTPAGLAVDMFGCPLDSDEDGVADYQDACPDTPRWTQVDVRGCPLDSDGDGVADDKDRCPDTPRGAVVNSVGCWVLSGVLFDSGKETIKPDMTSELDKVVQVLKQNPDLKIEVQGHTDSIGNADFNQNLSEKRALAVMNYLLSHGISAKRVRAKGLGESRPAASNDTQEGRAMNRRVELRPLP